MLGVIIDVHNHSSNISREIITLTVMAIDVPIEMQSYCKWLADVTAGVSSLYPEACNSGTPCTRTDTINFVAAKVILQCWEGTINELELVVTG